MDVIKTTPNLEFDVIYADGTRKRVPEGVLYEAGTDGGIIFHNDTDRPAVMLAATETALVALSEMGAGLAALVIGMAVSEKSRAALRDLAWFANDLLENRSAQEQGIFRLGQMDMQQSVVAMLTDAADGTFGITRAALHEMAERVKKMEVAHADT